MNVKTKITLDKIKEEYMMKENWRKKLIKKGFHDDNAKPLIKAISLHSDRVPLQSDRINTDKQDFQERTPFKFKQFVRAKKQVLKKRKEFLEKTQNLLEQNKKNENQKKIPYISESNKSNYKLDLTKLFNHEPMLSTKIKANKTSKFSYIFHEDDLSFKEKNFNTPVMGNDGKICDKSLKTEDSRKQISQRVKGKFEIALERLKKKKEALNINNISIKPNESESEARKNSLQKFINLMFKDRKKLKREENETNIENFERNKPMRNNPSSNVNRSKNNASLFRESCSQLYLYNNSFQNKSNATDNVNFETDRESKCVNIHVEKRKNSKKKNNNSVKALIYFKKAMKQGILSQESLK